MIKSTNPWPSILKAIRDQKCWTQVEAAEAFGVPARTWISWENGQYVPRKKSQRRLKEMFRIPQRIMK